MILWMIGTHIHSENAGMLGSVHGCPDDFYEMPALHG